MADNWWQLHKILWKQYFMKHRIWFLLLVFLIIILKVSQGGRDEAELKGITVGVCVYDEEGMQLLSKLQSEEEIFRFQLFEEEKELLRAVENGSLECGYVLPEDFFDNMLKGKIRRQIKLYYSSTSGVHKLSYEVVFSQLFGMLSDEILKEWLLQSGICNENDIEEGLKQLKGFQAYYREGDTTFSFQFEKVGVKKETQAATFDPMRGMVGVIIFFLSLLGLGNCSDLRKKAGAFSRHEAMYMQEWSLHIAVAGSVLTGGIFLVVIGNSGQMVKEILALLCYFIILEIYVRILKLILKTAQAVYSAIPVLLLGSVLFSPVFFRLENFIPAVGYLEKLFPVSWYLHMFF